MIVVADTSPINFLILIGEQELLAALFGRVIPRAVFVELGAEETPIEVRNWLANPPQWIEFSTTTSPPDPALLYLDEGEREAIQIAEELKADLLLVGEKLARREAAKRQLQTTGLLGCWIALLKRD